MFRYPTLSLGEYLSLYQTVSSGVWEGSESKRNDFATIYGILRSGDGRSILDIGCFTGRFLEGVPENFKKYGVEPSSWAANQAESRGIRILGRTLVDLEADAVFDVVVAIDIIEHVVDVEAFLESALAHVGKNGFLIVSTGNPESFAWRKIFKAKYWYCSYAEHLVFPSFKYFQDFSARHQLPPPNQIPFSYCAFNLPRVVIGLLHQLIYAVSPTAFSSFLKVVHRLKGGQMRLSTDIPPGAAGIFTDHQVVTFRKFE